MHAMAWRRRCRHTVMAASMATTGLMAGLSASSASADPAQPSGMSTLASIAGSSQTNVPLSGPLTALQNGTTVSITMTGSGATAGKFFGADVRLCKGGVNIQFQSQFNPTQGGNCVDQPMNAQSDDLITVSAAPTNTTATANFRVAVGTRTFAVGAGSSTITCDANNPCALWIKESFDTSVVPAGFLFFHYDITYAGAPGTPATTATGANTAGTVSWTAPTNTGNAPITSYTVSITPADAPAQTVSGTTTMANFTGLTNFTNYTASVTATNTAVDGTTHFSSATPGTAAFTPVPPAVTGVSATPADHSATISWVAPSGPTPTNYQITIHQPGPPTNPVAGADQTILTGSGTATSFNVTTLTNGTVYTAQVTAIYGTNTGAPSAASAPFTPQGKFVTQTITVTRPQGALVLTQICGNHSARPADPNIANWWPGSAALPAVASGSGPTLTPGGGTNIDPLFNQYPYPTDSNGDPTATYPTDCGVSLGKARFITSGPGAGQYFQAKGLLSQVTVVDTRDTDPGWTASGAMGTFNAGAGKSFSGKQLGWTAPTGGLTPGQNGFVTSTTPGFQDASGNTYTQTVAPGSAVAPGANGTGGLGGGSTLGMAAPAATVGTTTTGGLGISVFDADLKLLIPVFAKSGTYTGTLTLTAA